ncbi:MAG: YbaB/EbfC family nucleoid-associated protein, partial [Erysipelotrichaceae bacterium]|nr:YbaB/EbfC family nucleoid-associated protein [Erysipelotrichaceae bacterium]
SVNIDPSILNPDDKEMIEDLIMIAVNDTVDKAEELKKDRFGSMASAMGLPLK